MSNLQLIMEKYISILESDYSLIGKCPDQFLIYKNSEYNSLMYTTVEHSTQLRHGHDIHGELEITIFLSINKNLLPLYNSKRRESDNFGGVKQSLEVPMNMIKRAQDIVNCITVFTILAGKTWIIKRSKKRIYLHLYNMYNKSLSLEIHLDTNNVLYCNYKVTIDFFTGLINKFNPIDFVNNRIIAHEANQIFTSALSNEK